MSDDDVLDIPEFLRRQPNPSDKYSVLLGDAPWSYKKWNKKSGHGKANDHYRTMTKKQICDMGEQVQDLMAPNAALFLWATPPTIDDAREVMTAWGFKYRTFGFTWVKHYAGAPPKGTKQPMILDVNGDPHKVALGMGSYSRANAEPCLLGIRGRMPVDDRGVSSIILSPRLGHSQKPHEQYDLIQRLYPDAKKLELFARRKHEGWDAVGNDVDGMDIVESLKLIAQK